MEIFLLLENDFDFGAYDRQRERDRDRDRDRDRKRKRKRENGTKDRNQDGELGAMILGSNTDAEIEIDTTIDYLSKGKEKDV